MLEAINAMKIESNRVYVMPSNVDISITDGHFGLIPRVADHKQHLPIDIFMRSLAEARKSQASALFSRAMPRMVLRGADGNGWAAPIPLLLMASFGANS